jgi:hypothetical protein
MMAYFDYIMGWKLVVFKELFHLNHRFGDYKITTIDPHPGTSLTLSFPYNTKGLLPEQACKLLMMVYFDYIMGWKLVNAVGASW